MLCRFGSLGFRGPLGLLGLLGFLGLLDLLGLREVFIGSPAGAPILRSAFRVEILVPLFDFCS